MGKVTLCSLWMEMCRRGSYISLLFCREPNWPCKSQQITLFGSLLVLSPWGRQVAASTYSSVLSSPRLCHKTSTALKSHKNSWFRHFAHASNHKTLYNPMSTRQMRAQRFCCSSTFPTEHFGKCTKTFVTGHFLAPQWLFYGALLQKIFSNSLVLSYSDCDI